MIFTPSPYTVTYTNAYYHLQWLQLIHLPHALPHEKRAMRRLDEVTDQLFFCALVEDSLEDRDDLPVLAFYREKRLLNGGYSKSCRARRNAIL